VLRGRFVQQNGTLSSGLFKMRKFMVDVEYCCW